MNMAGFRARPQTAEKRQQIHVTLPESTHARLKAAAARDGVSANEWLIQAIDYLTGDKQGQQGGQQ